ncbi:hypothetical protein CMQ_2764 [Grosmannia clavigera kw1407]|uniref:Small secreted protein n=1 Tax=Grosmannia clavigera (strain kw1407 / UAMH 11150) TaxID=655863 RepID=F0XH59_GROCL|nr:uncharacterized protein CMQ_2764 [Grosmannia clavigera kw1407]EFX02835.1 hypothetical protein CMQ_2764 [Grosmannia clavigera kw1407]
MYFSKALILAFAASALALPMGDKPQKRAGVLSVSKYSDFQVSSGVAGDALAEVKAKFPIDYNDLANVDAGDLAIIQAARVLAESAEADTGGFNDAISAAGKSTAAGKALQVGKIKNKVLKLQLEVTGLQIQQAQTGTAKSADISQDTNNLNNNISLDKAAAGQTSQSIDFSGDDSA